MRLYDRITATRNGRTHLDDDLNDTFEMMEQSVKFDVSNVFEYVSGLDESNRDRISITDLPYVVPQFDNMWLEYQVPPGELSDNARWHYESGVTRFGLLLQTHDLTHDAMAEHIYLTILKPALDNNGKSLSNDPRWLVSERFAWQRHGVVEFIQVTRYWLIDAEGGFIYNTKTGEMLNAVTPFRSQWDKSDEIFHADYLRHVNRHTHLAPIMAISLSHCKNVAMNDAPMMGSRQQRRALERQGLKQTKFKMLTIEPMKQVLKTEGGIDHNGLNKAMHICRGHFATYSDDKPLFGKYTGTFWRPAHVRGNADNGTVYKDYKVKAPKEQP